MLLIGSRAAKYHIDDFRRPKDYDFIAYEHEIQNFANMNKDILRSFEKKSERHYAAEIGIGNMTWWVEFEIAEPGNSAHYLHERNTTEAKQYLVTPFYLPEYKMATVQDLLLIKMSHIYWPLKWQKHIEDFHVISRACGNNKGMHWVAKNGIPSSKDILKIRRQETEKFLGPLMTPKLNVSKAVFFGQSEDVVKSHFIHDDIHKAVAYHDRPVYEMMQRGDEVYCHQDLWKALPYEYKLHSVMEEAYTIALERIMIPFLLENGRADIIPAHEINSHNAYIWALFRVSTTLTGGWFRTFAMWNYPTLKTDYRKDYVEDFLRKVDQGLVRKTRDHV
jgi:hypothetical protein